ncbi:MAG: Hsp20/alpha crystallin family protein [Halanaerobiales bacterium]
MFNLVPFRNRRRNQVSEREDPFYSLVSDFFSDVMDVADLGFKTDIKEDENNYYIEAELPGLSKEDIKIEIDDDNLIISATNEKIEEEEKENYLRRERRSGTYQRSFRLDNVNEDGIEAEYEDGILNVVLPKEEPGKPQKRVIDIN